MLRWPAHDRGARTIPHPASTPQRLRSRRACRGRSSRAAKSRRWLVTSSRSLPAFISTGLSVSASAVIGAAWRAGDVGKRPFVVSLKARRSYCALGGGRMMVASAIGRSLSQVVCRPGRYCAIRLRAARSAVPPASQITRDNHAGRRLAIICGVVLGSRGTVAAAITRAQFLINGARLAPSRRQQVLISRVKLSSRGSEPVV
jgi:hypothetical protein